MIDGAVINEVLAVVEAEGASVSVISKLRERWGDIHFTHCMEDELCLEKPVREGTLANIYLVNGHNHCATITDHEPSATGLLIAELSE
jgi:hypothetical protein